MSHSLPCKCGHSSDDHTRKGVCLDDECECEYFHVLGELDKPIRKKPGGAVARTKMVATPVTDGEHASIREAARRAEKTMQDWSRERLLEAMAAVKL